MAAGHFEKNPVGLRPSLRGVAKCIEASIGRRIAQVWRRIRDQPACGTSSIP
jgi:hypothetical protein